MLWIIEVLAYVTHSKSYDTNTLRNQRFIKLTMQFKVKSICKQLNYIDVINWVKKNSTSDSTVYYYNNAWYKSK